MWHLAKWRRRGEVEYASAEWHESESMKGVRYKLARISLARRVEITSRVRALVAEAEYHMSGGGMLDTIAAAEVEARVNQAYLQCGLLEVRGLRVDGATCSVAELIERGPEGLCREIAARIRTLCVVSADERKN
ncbi:MAG: hypothetical protein HY821_22640 [Acidobacteria bacterium]|nr:hypothetical protein [Acidobacteriota bacterium]